jgi:hypothetical protein
LKRNEREKEKEATHMEGTQRFVTEEIEMLKVVLYLVCRNNDTRARRQWERGRRRRRK